MDIQLIDRRRLRQDRKCDQAAAMSASSLEVHVRNEICVSASSYGMKFRGFRDFREKLTKPQGISRQESSANNYKYT